MPKAKGELSLRAAKEAVDSSASTTLRAGAFAGYEPKAQGAGAPDLGGGDDDDPAISRRATELLEDAGDSSGAGWSKSLLDFVEDDPTGTGVPVMVTPGATLEEFAINTESSPGSGQKEEEEEQEEEENVDPNAKVQAQLFEALGKASTEEGNSALTLIAAQMSFLMGEVVQLRKVAAAAPDPKKYKGEEDLDRIERDKLRLTKIPYQPAGPGGRAGMPTVKGWQDWLEKHLKSWASLVCEHFDVWLLANLAQKNQTPSDLDIDGVLHASYKPNKWLGFEITSMMQEPLSTFVSKVSANDGYALVYKINTAILAECEERVNGLGNRFREPAPCSKKEDLAWMMEHWLDDLAELREAKATPDKHSSLSSLKKLISGVQEVKKVADLCDLVRPGDINALYQTVRRRANQWSSVASLPRLRPSGGGGGAQKPRANGAQKPACRFYLAGTCTHGNNCSFDHPQKGKGKGKEKGKGKGKEKGKGPGNGGPYQPGGGPGGGKGGGKSKTGKPAAKGGKDTNGNWKKAPGGGGCAICHDLSHWKNECPQRQQAAAHQASQPPPNAPTPPTQVVQGMPITVDQVKALAARYMAQQAQVSRHTVAPK